MAKTRGTITVDQERCKGCELCIVLCPPRVIGLSERVNATGYRVAALIDEEHCTGCVICARVCPDVAIEVYRLSKSRSLESASGR